MFEIQLLILFLRLLVSSCDIVEYYGKLIEKEVSKAKTYKFAEDAREYEPRDTTSTHDGGSFDFIIVGSGPTGSTLANKLSENKEWSVLLIDAGEFANNFTQIPGMEPDSLYSYHNWQIFSVPQTTACRGLINNSCGYPRGRGIGGGTIVNHMLYARGSPEDYDEWAAQGNQGWSYNDVLPYFKHLEDFHKTNEEAIVDWQYHGSGGPVRVEYPETIYEPIEAFYNANLESKYNPVDYNSRNITGVSFPQIYTTHGRRQDAGTVFVKTILKRKNFKVLTRSYVTKININITTKTAKSVEFSSNNKHYAVRAKKEIILSAGTFGSPQLLMISGVGPKNHLKNVGIQSIEDLAVGSNLRDHVIFAGLTYTLNWTIPVESLKEQIQQWLNGVGKLAYPGSLGGVGFYTSTLETVKGHPDLEILFFFQNSTALSGTNWIPWTNLSIATTFNGDPSKTVGLFISFSRTKSTGTVRLKSNNPYEFPLIDTNVLSDKNNYDINALYEGVQIAQKLINTKAFKKLNPTPNFKPLPQCSDFEYLSKDYWYCALRILSFPYVHMIGTCPMGPNPKNGAVVDSKLRVHGVKNLRVADASVFPITFSGHPSVPCMMLGAKTSDIIKEDYK